MPSPRFPHYRRPLQKLVQQHTTIQEEPLHLAIYYAPKRKPQDVFLFEVMSHFGSDSIAEEKELFEITFGPLSGFPIKPNQQLHFILTNPNECRVAFREGWPLANELRDAVRAGKFVVLFRDPLGGDLLELIHDSSAGVVGSG